jgi:hypothetical protein
VLTRAMFCVASEWMLASNGRASTEELSGDLIEVLCFPGEIVNESEGMALGKSDTLRRAST